jgi:uncharacterized protein YegL
MIRLFSKLVVLISLIALAGCGADGSANVGESSDCPTGQQEHPVTGECQPSTNNGGFDGGVPDGGGGGGDGGAGQDTGPDLSDQPWDDYDGDGVPNAVDNCPHTDNPDQTDSDGDGVGDACDNCPEVANADQASSSGNPVDDRGVVMGDACLPGEVYDPSKDHTGDGTPTIEDNCPEHYNPDQLDSDGDGVGDECDNCPNVPNYDQHDSTGDGVGDACSPEPVGDICDEQTTDFEILAPNVHIVFDKSGSMGGTPLSQAQQGLRLMADALADDIRFGLSLYPGGSETCSNWSHQLFPMGQHTAQYIRNQVNTISAGGITPTGAALNDVRANNWLTEPGDSLDDRREKIVILITDGVTNRCNSEHPPAARAGDLAAQGVPVYVVGFKSGVDPAELNGIAQAGGTNNPNDANRYYFADDSQDLIDAIESIAGDVISCSYTLDPPPEDGNKIWVEVDGEYTTQNPAYDYTYDANSNTLTLNEAACDHLQGLDPNVVSEPLKISMGCATECEDIGEEICDYKDNNCDGVVDPGCESCFPEVCDGTDNDCDGIIDNGCCTKEGESCQDDSDCCLGSCEEGVCTTPCRPLGVACDSSDQCCSGTCGGGSCAGG